MDLVTVHTLVEELRLSAIGEPDWIEKKQVFEYREQTPKVVAVLKIIRAAHGITAIEKLLEAGLFIDFGTIIRCIVDALDEATFLLEEYPKHSANVDKFTKAFFASTIDGYLEDESQPVPINKIRAAVVRSLKGQQDDATQKMSERIYKTFCGYVHANYAHIMEVYGGREHNFHLAGVPQEGQRPWRFEYLEILNIDVAQAVGLCAYKLGLKDVGNKVVHALRENDKRKNGPV